MNQPYATNSIEIVCLCTSLTANLKQLSLDTNVQLLSIYNPSPLQPLSPLWPMVDMANPWIELPLPTSQPELSQQVNQATTPTPADQDRVNNGQIRSLIHVYLLYLYNTHIEIHIPSDLSLADVAGSCRELRTSVAGSGECHPPVSNQKVVDWNVDIPNVLEEVIPSGRRNSLVSNVPSNEDDEMPNEPPDCLPSLFHQRSVFHFILSFTFDYVENHISIIH